MSTISTTTHRSFNMTLIVALALVFVAVFVWAVQPAIVAPDTAIIPAADSEIAYLEYLRGEKVTYSTPSMLDEALAAYHLGERQIFAAAPDLNAATWAWHLGEKFIVPAEIREAAMLEYLRGEKDSQ